jgi:hypothetical protein
MWLVTLSIQMSQPSSTSAVIFVEVNTQVTDVYGIKTDKQFVNTLEDNIIQNDAPLKLISERGQAVTSHKVADILHTFCIDNWPSTAPEPS